MDRFAIVDGVSDILSAPLLATGRTSGTALGPARTSSTYRVVPDRFVPLERSTASVGIRSMAW